MKKDKHLIKLALASWVVFVSTALIPGNQTLAADFTYNNPVTGVPDTPQGLFTNIIQGLLAISGSFALMMLVIGGFRYVTSAGEKDLIENAKSQIKAAIIGLIIILISYSVLTAVQTILLGG